jgi:hypothetical protein
MAVVETVEKMSPTAKHALINKLAERVQRLQVLVAALKAGKDSST